MPLIRSGGVTALATTATRRSRHLPDLPTMQEFLPGFAADWTYAICSRAGVEPAILRRIEDGARQAISSTAVTETMARLGFEPAFEAGDSFDQAVDADIRRWNAILARDRAERRVPPISP
ncbi:MAG TPA: tripartite tricarboxylate transporter substrate-binding protein [Roseomonas sp.]